MIFDLMRTPPTEPISWVSHQPFVSLADGHVQDGSAAPTDTGRRNKSQLRTRAQETKIRNRRFFMMIARGLFPSVSHRPFWGLPGCPPNRRMFGWRVARIQERR